MLKIFSHMFREQNVPRITAIHDTLRDIDARPRNVCLVVDVGDFTYRSAVNSHSNREWQASASQRLADLQCALRRRFRTVSEDQGHSVSRRYSYQPVLFLSDTKLLGSLHELIQLTK